MSLSIYPRCELYVVDLAEIPVDFFADPDGEWDYESLVDEAGFDLDEGVEIGALTDSFRGHPEGSAVVTLNAKNRPYVAIVECPISVQREVGEWLSNVG
jgi:hypothetical protein